MLRSGRQIRKVIFPQSRRFISVVQNAFACLHEIDLLTAWIKTRVAAAAGIECELSKAEHISQNPALRIAFAENRLVVAGGSRDINSGFSKTGNRPVQPGGLDGALLRKQGHREYERKNWKSFQGH